MTHSYKRPPQDKQAAMYGKVDNDFNKIGSEKPTQKNQGKRTPQSRGDRDDHLGNNQSHMRKGGPNQGEGRQKGRV
jgi:hypothetical protein